jgi:hypothetical protein
MPKSLAFALLHLNPHSHLIDIWHISTLALHTFIMIAITVNRSLLRLAGPLSRAVRGFADIFSRSRRDEQVEVEEKVEKGEEEKVGAVQESKLEEEKADAVYEGKSEKDKVDAVYEGKSEKEKVAAVYEGKLAEERVNAA